MISEKVKSGIYQIIHVASGRKYVGSAGDIGKRLGSHKANLRRNKHANIALQRAYNKYVENEFVFEKIYECTVDKLMFHEQRLIDELGSHTSKGGYNIRKLAHTSLGTRMKSRAYKAGDKYARVTFLEQIFDVEGASKKHQWRLKCDCGNEFVASGGNVKNGITRSCGCYKKDRIAETKRIDWSGQNFNRLVLMRPVGVRRHVVLWECLCDCGNSIVAPSAVVVNGNTKSCGCLNLENARNMMMKMRETNSYKFVLFGKTESTTSAAKILGVSRNSFLCRINRLKETPQQACDHFVRKTSLKTIASCNSIIQKSIAT